MSKKQKVKIKLKSYDSNIIVKSAQAMVSVIKKTKVKVRGPIPLPVYIKKFTILTSPHVDKKSRDQYEIREYKRLIIIISPTEKILNLLMKFKLSASVDAKISIIWLYLRNKE